MSKSPSIAAAIGHLRKLAAGETIFTKDAEAIHLVCDALSCVEDLAEHIDSRDANPVYELTLPCVWLEAKKGFLHALSLSIRESHESEQNND